METLRRFCRSSYTDSDRALELINSIDRSMQIFSYHLISARDANQEITPDSTSEWLDLIFTTPGKVELIETLKVTIQANAQAAVHVARSVHEIFGQLVNHLILSDQIPLEKCSLYLATQKLKPTKLRSHLEEVQASDEYLYVNAMVNTLKHRSLVSFRATASFENDKAGVQFQSFEYKDKVYPAHWAKEVLEKAIFVKNAIVTSGILLNEQVGANEM